MNFLKFKSLSIWEKLGVIGSIASIFSIVIYFLPAASSPNADAVKNPISISGNDNNPIQIDGNSGIININSQVNIEKIVATLTDKHQQDIQTKDEQIKALTQAVSDLSKGQGIFGTDAQIEQAMSALAKGDTTEAENLFTQAAQKGDQEAKHTAQAYLNLGALAYSHDTQKALDSYRRATELDPDNAEGWNRLGHLLLRIGELNKAIEIYEKVLQLGDIHQNLEEESIAFGNLGIAYQMSGELDKAIAFHEKALSINKSLNFKEGMANNYGNLGIVYKTRGELYKAIELHEKALAIDERFGLKEGIGGDYGNLGATYDMLGKLDKALEFYKKSLAIEKKLGFKEGMAIQYGNLGGIYEQKGNKFEAKRHYQMSIELFKQLGSPNAQKVQASLDYLQ
ncbi:MAG: tetratricopeptide repeat protein [Methylococcales bacterium]|nr:tetratricopeptide repeat protein [Methylococcales bacterium]